MASKCSEIGNFVLSIVHPFKLDYKCLITQLKLSVQGMTITFNLSVGLDKINVKKIKINALSY